MTSAIKDFYAGAVLAILLAVASCDRPAEKPAAGEQTAVTTTLPAPAGSEDTPEYASRESSGPSRDDAGERADSRGDDPRDRPVAVHDSGRPMWAANRSNSAQENAERRFRSYGDEFGAKSVDQYVDMAHAFIGDPPKGTLRLTRSNGDKLYYDPKGNVFAVATRDGAPRVMFKPREGMSYWREQEQQVASRRSSGDRG
jgi:pyocin large subunit-like protein